MNVSRTRHHGDEGAMLILALLIITSIALVTTALVGQSFTNTAATLTTRNVAAGQYAADAAAQYATNQLRLSDLSSGLCSSTTAVTSEDLNNFYPSGLTTVAQKAHVDCAPDSTNGGGAGGTSTSCPADPAPCPNAAPGTALLTLDPNASDTGIYVNSNGGNIKIRGGVFSNSQINIVAGGLQNTWCPANPPGSKTYDCTRTSPKTYVIARGTCSSGISFSQTGATQQCSYSRANDPRGADPGVARTGYTPAASYGTPAAPSGQATSQSCTTLTNCTADVQAAAGPPVVAASICGSGTKFQQVLPGRIAGAAGLAFLNSLTGCSKGIIQFTPGKYYFDLPSSWSPPAKVTVVGGTFASGYDPVAGTGPGGWPGSGGDYEDACLAPGDAAATTSSGVQFVIGGATQFNINNSAGSGSHVTLCASNSADGPPIVLYGLTSAIGSGTTAVSASTLCSPDGRGSTACALIQTANSPNTTVNLVGMTYTPRSTIHISLNNSSSKLFYWGVVSYAMEFRATGSPTLIANLIDVQDGWPSDGVTTNRYYLNVFTCAVSASRCPAAGADADVKAVVQVGADLSGNALPPGNVLVLGWSVKR